MHSAPAHMRTSIVLALLVLGAAAGCTKPRSSAVVQTADVATPAATATPATPATEDTQAPKSRRRPSAVGVFVDGRAVGVLRASELPSTVPSKKLRLGEKGEYEVTRYEFTKYFATLGIPVDRIRAVHFHGGSRVAIMEGDEVRRTHEHLEFSFAAGDHGKPRLHLPSKAKFNTSVDMLSRVTVYVDKPAPTLNEEGDLVLDGKVVKGVAHAPTDESSLGTRIYLDGKLVGSLRRRSLPNKFLLPGNEPGKPARFSVAQYAESLGVDLKKTQAVDVVTGDDVVGRLKGDAARSLAFTVPNHTHGNMLVQVGTVTTKVSALEFFTHTPPARTISEPQAFDPATPDGAGDDDETSN